MRVALLQITSSDVPADNLAVVQDLMQQARAGGADFVFTPEVTNCVSASRTRQTEVLRVESQDETLAGLCRSAASLGLWLSVGSLALRSDPPEPRFANRSFLIGPEGQIVARYDKMHMFDVQVTETETYRESSGYAPGAEAVVADTPFGHVGMTVCYDVRFAYLYRALAQAGAEILTVPAAFSPATGPMHWEPLLRARAIETGCFVIAAAQVGDHPAMRGKARSTYGHSMVVSPWGEVILDAGVETGVHYVDLDIAAVRQARQKIPALNHDITFKGPQ
jgi:predicted amidohydrolase